MSQRDTVKRLLDEHGTTYAAQAGIRLADKPAPLYQLLVLTTLQSTRIKADIAVAAAKELFKAGWRTPEAMRGSTWQQRVDALGRGHYVRYDESTATALAEGAEYLRDTYRDDLRNLADECGHDQDRLIEALTGFPRIGPVGARIFCREAQAAWPWLRPFFDQRARDAAGDLGLPKTPDRLGQLVPSDDVARLAAALVRVRLS